MSLDELDVHLLGSRLANWLGRADNAALRLFRQRCAAFVVDTLDRTQPHADSLDALRSMVSGADLLLGDSRSKLQGILAEAERRALKRVTEHPGADRLHAGPLNTEELEWWAVRAARALLYSDVQRGAALAASAAFLASDTATVIAIAQRIDKDA